jgi:hypothetical protein
VARNGESEAVVAAPILAHVDDRSALVPERIDRLVEGRVEGTQSLRRRRRPIPPEGEDVA